MPKQKTLRLILGDQLNEQHSWFQKPDKNVSFVLMEIRQETDYVVHHIQKVAAFFAATQELGIESDVTAFTAADQRKLVVDLTTLVV